MKKSTLIVALAAVALLAFAAPPQPQPPQCTRTETSLRQAWRDFAGDYIGKGKPESKAERAAEYADLMIEQELARFGVPHVAPGNDF